MMFSPRVLAPVSMAASAMLSIGRAPAVQPYPLAIAHASAPYAARHNVPMSAAAAAAAVRRSGLPWLQASLSARSMSSSSSSSSDDDTPSSAFFSAASSSGMALGRLAETLRAVEEEPARLARTALMTELLATAMRDAPDELLPCIALATMQLLPGNRALKLGVGENLVLQALGDACACLQVRLAQCLGGRLLP